jgi:hypothetical protein
MSSSMKKTTDKSIKKERAKIQREGKGRKEEKVMEKMGKASNHSMGRGAGGGGCRGKES